jgi:endonuclease YncB( thermonuclease family)
VYEYDAVVLDKYRDGDTFWAHVDYGMRQGGDWSIRVRDLWCPERDTARGRAATERGVELMPAGTIVRLRTFKRHSGGEVDSMGRWVASVELPDGLDFATRIVFEGHGTTRKEDPLP